MRAVLRAVVSSVLLLGPGLAQDPPPAPAATATARRLVYELPVDALQRSLQGRKDTDLEQLLAQTVVVLRGRVAPELVITRDGATGFTVDVPAARAAELAAVRRRVEAAGTMEMVLVANPETPAIDLPRERERLTAWLDTGGRARVLKDGGKALDAFHADPAEGPIAGTKLRWVVHRITRQPNDPTRWTPSFAPSPKLAAACVRLFDDAQWNGGIAPPAAVADTVGPSELLELIALDRTQGTFDHSHFDGARSSRVAAPDPGLLYTVRAEHAAMYATWSEKNIGRACAIVWNGELIAAPIFHGKIAGRGLMSGPTELMEDIEIALRSGALPVPPRFVRDEPLPAKR